jgi:hypothetical protein
MSKMTLFRKVLIILAILGFIIGLLIKDLFLDMLLGGSLF